MSVIHLVIFLSLVSLLRFFLFFFTDTATTEIYTLSLHDALPIFATLAFACFEPFLFIGYLISIALFGLYQAIFMAKDRKSTRLNSSHRTISYAVFCLKKKNKNSTKILATTTSTSTMTQLSPTPAN